ncbi:universal stress protein [Phycicoccus sonneratiae]|uniref:Universal stress protein n=1 Tax=Phycicoccus sonneratiae TaxID=2807628 RepID=A0ABS2CJF5_9MICO|nr:universal stress protein [Phycicoccus sonneraticus]MBM6400007.1 universal stress protein [Phycicoccus sonneraticus]
MAEDVLSRQSDRPPEGTGHRPVVAALDGSSREDSVVAWAAAAASRWGVRLDLVHVVDPGITTTPYAVFATETPWFGERLEANARERLEARAAMLRERHPGLEVSVRAPFGSPPAVLVGLSERATVVVGASTHGRLERWVLGSTALAVVAHGHGTVVVVPESLPPVEPHRVVVGADGSDAGARALAVAVGEAAAVGGRVTAVTAWTVEVEDGVVVAEPGTERWARVETRLAGGVRASVAGALADRPEVPVEVVVRHGAPAPVLLDVVREQGADLLVVGRRGHGGFAGLLMGSVSRAVAQRAPVPVAVVH